MFLGGCGAIPFKKQKFGSPALISQCFLIFAFIFLCFSFHTHLKRLFIFLGLFFSTFLHCFPFVYYYYFFFFVRISLQSRIVFHLTWRLHFKNPPSVNSNPFFSSFFLSLSLPLIFLPFCNTLRLGRIENMYADKTEENEGVDSPYFLCPVFLFFSNSCKNKQNQIDVDVPFLCFS